MPKIEITKYKIWYNVEVHYTVNGEEQEPFDVVSDEPANRIMELAAMHEANLQEVDIIEMLEQEQAV